MRLTSVPETAAPAGRRDRAGGPRPGAARRPLVPALTWRTSTFLFVGPILLLLATLAVQQRSAGPEPILLTVQDGFTGAPLAGARVTIGDREITTDDDGRVELAIGDEPLSVAVAHDQYEAKLNQIDPAGGDQLAVQLRPTSLEGAITDAETGAPIAGATVTALTANGEPGPTTTTGDDGRYSLTDLPPDATLQVASDRYGTTEHPAGEQTRLDLALTVSVVTGVVRTDAGEPIPGAIVSGADSAGQVETGADGAFRLANAEGVAELLVRAPGFGQQRVAIPAERHVETRLQPERIKAIYASDSAITDPDRWNRLIEIADQTEINAIVVDVKQDTIYYDTGVEFFRQIDGMVTPLYDPAELLATLDEHGIYSIARMVVFKDPIVAEGRPDLAVRDEVSGGLWRDMNGTAWVNAFNEELWDANADLAAELAQLGFDEIQYDYIRFPSDGDLTTADFGPDYSEAARRAAITGAVALGAERVHANGAQFAIDLFPIVALQGNDQGIGQTIQDLVPLADSVNLMVYPSHYERGNIPVDGHPNDFPAETVTHTLEAAERLMPGSRLKMRPWLQDFTYPLEGYSAYGPAEVRAQIDAAEAFGASGWLLWNAAAEFEVDALRPE